MISAKIVLDSESMYGHRLTTFELEYPRFIHAEVMTHRVFSRNAASSRAIPTKKFRKNVLSNTALPVYWGRAGKGMSAHGEVENKEAALNWWMKVRDTIVSLHEEGEGLGLSKELVNRVIESHMNIRVILTATEFSNFFFLRRAPDAQPEIRELANCMFNAYINSKPSRINFFEWHLPYITYEDKLECQYLFNNSANKFLKQISAARCARVSYLTHDGKRDLDKDIELFDKLVGGASNGEPGHWSPLEHVATPHIIPRFQGNFYGWKQFRKTFKNENHTSSLLL